MEESVQRGDVMYRDVNVVCTTDDDLLTQLAPPGVSQFNWQAGTKQVLKVQGNTHRTWELPSTWKTSDDLGSIAWTPCSDQYDRGSNQRDPAPLIC